VHNSHIIVFITLHLDAVSSDYDHARLLTVVIYTRFLRNGKKNYIYFIDNLLLFPTVKELSKSVNS